MSDPVQKLISLLEDPNEEWCFADCYITHSSTGVSVWVANMPVLNTNTFPVAMPIGLLDKWRLWKAVKVAKLNALEKKLKARDA